MTVLLLGLANQNCVDYQTAWVLELGKPDGFFHGSSNLENVLREFVTHPLEGDIKRHS